MAIEGFELAAGDIAEDRHASLRQAEGALSDAARTAQFTSHCKLKLLLLTP